MDTSINPPREEIVEMALEAGFALNDYGQLGDGFWSDEEQIMNLVALVIAAERKRWNLALRYLMDQS